LLLLYFFWHIVLLGKDAPKVYWMGASLWKWHVPENIRLRNGTDVFSHLLLAQGR
jgi:hypothetical protein